VRQETKASEMRTVLLAIKLSDAVASVVVLTETVLLLPFVKGGVVVPSGSGLGVGTSVVNFALQNVDCTRNDERASDTTATRTRQSLVCTFVNSVGHDVESSSLGDRRHCEEKGSARNEREREQKLVVVVIVVGCGVGY